MNAITAPFMPNLRNLVPHRELAKQFCCQGKIVSGGTLSAYSTGSIAKCQSLFSIRCQSRSLANERTKLTP